MAVRMTFRAIDCSRGRLLQFKNSVCVQTSLSAFLHSCGAEAELRCSIPHAVLCIAFSISTDRLLCIHELGLACLQEHCIARPVTSVTGALA